MGADVRASREALEPGSDFRPFPLEEFEARWQRVHDEIARKGYEAAVVWGKTSGVYERSGDMLYLTNFYSTHSGQEPDTELWNGRSYSAAISLCMTSTRDSVTCFCSAVGLPPHTAVRPGSSQ